MNTPSSERGTDLVKRGLAEMLKGGVIMDVVNVEQARIAEAAGAVAVMALERVPADIRAAGGVARMSDPTLVTGIMDAVTIPVMAKARIGHFVEAQVLEALGVDYIDESEVLTPADEDHHIDKWSFTTPFVCGARNLGEALRRIGEGAAMIRTKGEAGTGNIVQAVQLPPRIAGSPDPAGTQPDEPPAPAVVVVAIPIGVEKGGAEADEQSAQRGDAGLGAGRQEHRLAQVLVQPGFLVQPVGLVDDQRRQAAREQVRQWRERGELPPA